MIDIINPGAVTKTAKDAIEALRTVVSGREDFVYPGAASQRCFNFQLPGLDANGHPAEGWRPEHVPTLVPSCVVGHVLDLWELDREYWLRVEGGVEQARDALCDIERMGDYDQFVPDRNAVSVLGRAQGIQDAGGTWGESLAAAEALYRQLSEAE